MSIERLRRATRNMWKTHKEIGSLIGVVVLYIAGAYLYLVLLKLYNVPHYLLFLAVGCGVWWLVCIVIDNYVWDYNPERRTE